MNDSMRAQIAKRRAELADRQKRSKRQTIDPVAAFEAGERFGAAMSQKAKEHGGVIGFLRAMFSRPPSKR